MELGIFFATDFTGRIHVADLKWFSTSLEQAGTQSVAVFFCRRLHRLREFCTRRIITVHAIQFSMQRINRVFIRAPPRRTVAFL